MFSDVFILERKFQEPLMVTCTLPSPSENMKHEISCINLNSGVKLSKCMLGFDSENRLFKSQRLQSALSFCHKNVEAWYREVRLVPNLQNDDRFLKIKQVSIQEFINPECVVCKRFGGFCEECSANNYGENYDEQKQIISKEMIEKFPKSRKWYKQFKLIKTNSPDINKLQDKDVEVGEKVKSIERYKDMSKLIEEKFGKKSHNPVKKSASFMFTKRVEGEENSSDYKENSALLKCQSLDNQLHSVEEPRIKGSDFKNPNFQTKNSDIRSSKSNLSDNLSYDFQMCILNNENSFTDFKCLSDFQSLSDYKSYSEQEHSSIVRIGPTSLQITNTGFEEIRSVEDMKLLKKSKPDLIPTLTKGNLHTSKQESKDQVFFKKANSYMLNDKINKTQDKSVLINDNSFITDKLCSEFQVKCKIPKKIVNKNSSERLRNHYRADIHSFSIFDVEIEEDTSSHSNKRSVVAQIHEVSKVHSTKPKLEVDDLPYSKVADEVSQKTVGKKNVDENIYAEICEDSCNCDNKKVCECKRTRGEYCYVKLGSNGESVTSDSDEAIYNTLR